jgi:DNA-binding transcriptional regulator WhiA
MQKETVVVYFKTQSLSIFLRLMTNNPSGYLISRVEIKRETFRIQYKNVNHMTANCNLTRHATWCFTANTKINTRLKFFTIQDLEASRKSFFTYRHKMKG